MLLLITLTTLVCMTQAQSQLPCRVTAGNGSIVSEWQCPLLAGPCMGNDAVLMKDGVTIYTLSFCSFHKDYDCAKKTLENLECSSGRSVYCQELAPMPSPPPFVTPATTAKKWNRNKNRIARQVESGGGEGDSTVMAAGEAGVDTTTAAMPEAATTTAAALKKWQIRRQKQRARQDAMLEAEAAAGTGNVLAEVLAEVMARNVLAGVMPSNVGVDAGPMECEDGYQLITPKETLPGMFSTWSFCRGTDLLAAAQAFALCLH